jgi:hypothetical protein
MVGHWALSCRPMLSVNVEKRLTSQEQRLVKMESMFIVPFVERLPRITAREYPAFVLLQRLPPIL